VTIEGEFVSISERVVHSPAWGRLDPDPVPAGLRIEAGRVIGRVRQPKAVIPLVSPVTGRFLEWLALEGEPVRPGTALARLRADDAT
jgi:multidrug efflux pump subunit AcrA (membrane-fusion protein)